MSKCVTEACLYSFLLGPTGGKIIDSNIKRNFVHENLLFSVLSSLKYVPWGVDDVEECTLGVWLMKTRSLF